MEICQSIETPFEYRHVCWFCGEPSCSRFVFAVNGRAIIEPVHPSLSLNVCQECSLLANKSNAENIWQVRLDVKQGLMRKYHKHLAIGINWTQQELEQAEFEGGNFETFKRSAWMMYEIAKARVSFNSWPIEIAGIDIEERQYLLPEPFVFDGVEYPSLDDAICHYVKNFSLHKAYFMQVLSFVGKENFSKAVRFCRLQVGATPDERKHALLSLSQESVI